MIETMETMSPINKPLNNQSLSDIKWGLWNHKQWVTLGRAGIYLVLLVLTLLFHLSQSGFYNWSTYFLFYSVALIGLGVHGLRLVWPYALTGSKKDLFTYFVDVLLISYLMSQSGLSPTLFIFLYLIIILFSGLCFQAQGTWMVAATVSLGYSCVTLLGPEVRAWPMFFGLVINNAAFLSVAWISSSLAEQLESQGFSLSIYRNLNESIVDTIPSGIVTILENGSVVKFNPASQAVFGARLAEGNSILESWPELEKLVEQARIHRRKTTGDLKFNRETENLILAVQVIPQMTALGLGFLLIFDDLTVVRRLEFAVKQKEKLAAIGSLVTGIAHEIRNPLAGMSGNLELAMDPTLEPELRTKVSKNVFKEVDRLNRIITELMEYAKPEKVPVNPVQLDQILKEVLELVQKDPQVPQALQVQRDLAPVPEVRGDHDKLKQAFLNIILNAVQAMEQSSSPRLTISTQMHAQFVEVSVKDNGCGISEETKKKMFEPFVTTKPRGTGLGLAVTHKILESHQAQIEVDSKVGEGTNFRMLFPRENFDLIK